MNQNDQQRPTPETDTAIKAAIINEDEDHERLAAVARQLERERNEAREQLEAMREAIKEAHGALETCKVTGPLASEGKWASDHYKFDRLKVKAALNKLQLFLEP